MVKVRVVKCSQKGYWYENYIGDIYTVKVVASGDYMFSDFGEIDKEDAEVVEDVEKSCMEMCGIEECPDGWSCGMKAGKFENIGRSLGELVDEKQQAYGDAITAVEQMMMVLYPNGVNPDQFRDMLLMVRIMDKQCRIAKGDKSAFGESPFKDIAGYGLLGVGHGS